MQGFKRTTMALTALAMAFTLAPTASAAGEQPDKPRDILDKAEYAPGEAIKIAFGTQEDCTTQATSAGFVATITLTPGPTTTIGEGTAVETPGTYQAKIYCRMGSLVDTFTVKGPVTTTTPPPVSTTKPAPTQKPPVKKPKGAPQTGGGGTA